MVAAVFIAQDIHATAQGHWSFSPRFAGTLKNPGASSGGVALFPDSPLRFPLCVCLRQRISAGTDPADTPHNRPGTDGGGPS
ncbi:hypothetical protein [Marispirochaeta sp.]|uniref:hypothetical protein n=1 Tax=Marispirochaeta sp. TaxID=2038653 RepID=UPI0029C7CD9F|nr:hypothetical protein [Marispirochaeta sp.]